MTMPTLKKGVMLKPGVSLRDNPKEGYKENGYNKVASKKKKILVKYAVSKGSA